jgi:ADP-ribose pyrophosphatase
MTHDPKPQALARSLIYSSRWVNLYVDRVQFPNGSIIEQHHLLDFNTPSVMVIARDDLGRYLMVQVCRYPTGRSEWEFPAGSVEPGEEVIAAAQRELLEETGCRSTDMELLFTFHPLNGISNKVEHILRCRALPAEQGYDAGEISGVAWFTGEQIWQMIRSGAMQDGYALLSFLLDREL